jgi:hypothetical protein
MTLEISQSGISKTGVFSDATSNYIQLLDFQEIKPYIG